MRAAAAQSSGRRCIATSTGSSSSSSTRLLCAPAARPGRAAHRSAVRVAAAAAKKVVVTGAAGRTGRLVVEKLLEKSKGAGGSEEGFDVVATVRSRGGAAKLGLPESAVVEFDLAAAAAAGSAPPALQEALKGADALVIATSGVPQINYLSLIPVMLAKVTGKEGVRPTFRWKQGEMPEQIDWLGQKVQIDAAKAAGVRQVVLVSSMGGTDPNHPLNALGAGNILQWKRRAEQYLAASGLTYTIIHPGGLIDEAGGARALVVGVDDTLLERNPRNIPRADVAALAVGCIGLKEAANRSFDVICAPPGEGGGATTDYGALLAALQGNCDYSINSQLEPAAAAAR